MPRATPRLAKLLSIRALALSCGVPKTTMQRRIARLEAEGPCPWVVRTGAAKSGRAVLINVELMRAQRPELFDPVCVEEQVHEHEAKLEAVAEVIRNLSMRVQQLERAIERIGRT